MSFLGHEMRWWQCNDPVSPACPDVAARLRPQLFDFQPTCSSILQSGLPHSMEMEGITNEISRFEFTPLPDARTHIRLLEVQKVEDGKAVHCRLSEWALEHAPSYDAISYTWGDSGLTTEITVNGKPMEVRQNCDYVLRQASWHGSSQYYWLDAICISQSDADEKSEQVRMMGDIFGRAQPVLACVGPHADDSEFIFKFFRKHKRLLTPPDLLEMSQSFSAGPDPSRFSWWWRCALWPIRVSFPSVQRVLWALEIFFTRQYFSRVWVVQELFVGSRIVWCCGEDHVSQEHLWCLMGISPREGLLTSERGDSLDEDFGYPPGLKFIRLFIGQPRRDAARCWKDRGTSNRMLDFPLLNAKQWLLRRALDHISLLECQDPRDKVYGSLPLGGLGGGRPDLP